VKVIDVHPEELLDRELRGQLSADQRFLLDAHLAQCESCRLERLLRADFAAEAARACEADMQSFVLGALQRAASGEAQVAINVAAQAAPHTTSRRRMSATLAVACVLLVAAGAAASRSAWVERMFNITFGEASIESAPTSKSKRAAKFPNGTAPASAVQASASASAASASMLGAAQNAAVQQGRPAQVDARGSAREQDQPDDAERAGNIVVLLARGSARVDLPRVEPAREARTPVSLPARTLQNNYRPAPRSARITGARSGKLAFGAERAPKTTASLAPAQAAVEPKLVAPAAPVAPDPGRVATQAAAASLFEQANKARRNGRLDQAATFYENLQRDYAASAEAKLSFALEARMWLDAGNTYAALGGFDRYLATGERALREEAMTGRAVALERLGRSAAADQAFAELLKVYPYSSYAPLAKKRLGQD
jgi:tetratricopeptide (TPR) repeat protein